MTRGRGGVLSCFFFLVLGHCRVPGTRCFVLCFVYVGVWSARYGKIERFRRGERERRERERDNDMNGCFHIERPRLASTIPTSRCCYCFVCMCVCVFYRLGDTREEKVFRMWINSLAVDNGDLYINNLFADVQNGYAILKVRTLTPHFRSSSWGTRIDGHPHPLGGLLFPRQVSPKLNGGCTR